MWSLRRLPIIEYRVSSTVECMLPVPAAACLRCAGVCTAMLELIVDFLYVYSMYTSVQSSLWLLETNTHPRESLPVIYYSSSIRAFEPLNTHSHTSFMLTTLLEADKSFPTTSQAHRPSPLRDREMGFT